MLYSMYQLDMMIRSAYLQEYVLRKFVINKSAEQTLLKNHINS